MGDLFMGPLPLLVVDTTSAAPLSTGSAGSPATDTATGGAMSGAGIGPYGATTYDDPIAGRSTLAFDEGWRLMGYFLGTE